MPRSLLVVGIVLLGATAAAAQPVTKFDPVADADRFPRLFEPFNVKAGQSVTVTRDGVLIELTPAAATTGPIGARAEITLKGNFEVSVKYELLDFPDAVTDGTGTCVGMSAAAAAAVGLAATGRGVYQRQGQAYTSSRKVPMPTGPAQWAISRAPAASRHGRFGIRRVGSEAVYLAADAPDGELLEFKRYPFTDGPVRVVRLFGDLAKAAVPLKARLYDFQLRTGADVPTAPAKPGPRASTVLAGPPGFTAVVSNPPPGQPATTSPVPKAAPVAGPAAAPPADVPPGTTAPVRGGYLWVGVVVLVVGLVAGVAIGRRWRVAQKS